MRCELDGQSVPMASSKHIGGGASTGQLCTPTKSLGNWNRLMPRSRESFGPITIAHVVIKLFRVVVATALSAAKSMAQSTRFPSIHRGSVASTKEQTHASHAV